MEIAVEGTGSREDSAPSPPDECYAGADLSWSDVSLPICGAGVNFAGTQRGKQSEDICVMKETLLIPYTIYYSKCKEARQISQSKSPRASKISLVCEPLSHFYLDNQCVHTNSMALRNRARLFRSISAPLVPT